MSAPGENAAPVIIKRKKIVAGGGHHGGAWKVAYADFVTAMMAFFLLMWLLNATTEKQRKGIADYFSPTIPINRISGGGNGNFGGDSVFSEDVLPQNGTGASNRHPTESRQARGEVGLSDESKELVARESPGEQKNAAFEQVEGILNGIGGEGTISEEAQRHLATRVTDEGLVIELFDLEAARLFEGTSDQPTPLLRELADIIVSVCALVENDVALEGHTHARPVVQIENPVWGLSAARAEKMRVLLQDAGLAAKRMRRVTGHADRKPAIADPMAIRNNRIEIILLRSQG